MNRNKILGATCAIFATISAMFAMGLQPIGATGFAIAAGIAGFGAGFARESNSND